jgi:MFS family permease
MLELPIPPTPQPLGNVLLFAIGILLLVMGRKIFWLALGAFGFLAGLYLASRLPVVEQANEPMIGFAIAGACGVVGILLAIFVQKVAIGVAGFLAGGLGALWLALTAALPVGGWEWAVFLVGGVLGAILAGLLFEVALVVLTALLGATLLLELVTLDPRVEGILALVLTAVGCLIQGRRRTGRRT